MKEEKFTVSIYEKGKEKKILITGKKVKLHPKLQTFLHREVLSNPELLSRKPYWVVSEILTGRSFVSDTSKVKVIKRAKEIIEEIGLNKFNEAIEKFRLK